MNGLPGPAHAPRQGHELQVGLVPGPAGRRVVALIIDGKPIPLDQAQAQQLGVALLSTAAVASVPPEELRKLLLSAETGLVLPPGAA